jgi:transposase
MIGRERPSQEKIFYKGFSLEDRVRKNHPLRAVKKLIDFEFIYQEVADTYGYNGNVSVPPSVILKLLFLLFFYDVASERELMDTVPERLDWLWFLGYDFDDEIPHHSVLSKARCRWGKAVFKEFFVRVVEQCVALGLVDGDKLFCDASLVNANASCDSVQRNVAIEVIYGDVERRLDDTDDGDVEEGSDRNREKKYVSVTDSDAAVVRGHGGARPRYKEHRSVDGKFGVVTAVDVTSGDRNEAHQLSVLKEEHEANTGYGIETVVADCKYGTIENYLYCYDKNVVAHIPDMKDATSTSGHKKGIYNSEEFRYIKEEDVYICPGGERLERKRYHRSRDAYDYCALPEVCAVCKLKKKCTRSKTGRSIKRHVRQDELEMMRREIKSIGAMVDLKKRQHLVERSFADAANNHGFKRARWRRLWRVQIQDYLIAAIQNIRIMMKRGLKRVEVVAKRVQNSAGTSMVTHVRRFIHCIIRFFIKTDTTTVYATTQL